MSNKIIKKGIWALTWPICIENLLVVVISSVDVFIVSRISDAGVAAIGAVNVLMLLMFMLFNAMGQGSSLIFSRYLGAKNSHGVEKLYFLSFLLNLLIGVLGSIVFLLFSNEIGSFLGLEGELHSLGSLYLSIVGGVAVFHALTAVFSAIMAANGFTKYSMMVSIVINIVNTALSVVLAFGYLGFPELGIFGVAIATAVARLVGLIFSAWLTFIHLKIKFQIFYDGMKSELVKLMKIVVPITLEPFLWHGAQVVSIVIIAMVGPESLAARTYLITIFMYVNTLSLSLAQSTQIYLSHLYGSANLDDLKSSAIASLKIGTVIPLILMVGLFYSGDVVLGFFTTDKEILNIGVSILLIGCVTETLKGYNQIIGSSLRSINEVNYPVIIAAIFMWIFFLPTAYWLAIPLSMGLFGVWLSIAIDELARAILMTRRFYVKLNNKMYLPLTV